MDCKEIEAKWDEYLKDKLSPEEEREMENHIESCEKCGKKLENELESQSQQKGLSYERERKILRRAKWKNRIGNAIFIAAIVLLITITSWIITAAFYGLGDPSRFEKAQRVSLLLTEMTMPNVSISSSGMKTNIFFSVDGDYKMTKRVGRENKNVGNLEMKLFLNRLNINRDWQDGQLESYIYFVYPDNKNRDDDLSGSDDWSQRAWNTLEKLPEGTVTEMAFSLDDVYSLRNFYNILEEYDLDILWMAVDSGQEKHANNEFLGMAGGNLFGVSNFGISETVNFYMKDSQDRSSYSLAEYDFHTREKALIYSLEFLVENKGLTKRAYREFSRVREPMFKERLDHIRENGLNVYGAVVTGPSKELLLLQELDEVKHAVTGDIEWWNWEGRAYRSTLY